MAVNRGGIHDKLALPRAVAHFERFFFFVDSLHIDSVYSFLQLRMIRSGLGVWVGL
jgi:hypothetical protein